jgi:chromosome segregation ATPase
MEATFTVLYTASSTGLERIEHIKKSCDDIDGELASLRCRLASLSGQTTAALASARTALDAQNAEMAEAKTALEATRVELETLESKMEHRKTARNALRAVGSG